jgi:hypothetical protein
VTQYFIVEQKKKENKINTNLWKHKWKIIINNGNNHNNGVNINN